MHLTVAYSSNTQHHSLNTTKVLHTTAPSNSMRTWYTPVAKPAGSNDVRSFALVEYNSRIK